MKSKARNRLSFRFRTTLILVMMIVIIVVSMAAILYDFFRKSSQETVYNAIDMAISVNAGQIKQLVEQIETAVVLVNDNEDLYLEGGETPPEFASMVCNYRRLPDNSDLYQMVQSYESCTTSIDQIFEDCFRGEDLSYFARAFISPDYPITNWLNKNTGLSLEGNTIVCGSSVFNDDWYQQTLIRDGQHYWFTLAENDSWLYLAKLLKYHYVENMALSEHQFAVLVVGFETEWISERINAASVTENTCIWITDRNNRPIYASNPELADQFEEFGYLPTDQTDSYTVGEEEYVVQRTDLNDELFMVTAMPMRDISEMNSGIVHIIITVVVWILVSGVVLASVLSIYVARPIHRLAAHMNNGKLEPIEFVYKENDEMSALYFSFNDLVSRLKEMLQNVIEASEKKKQAELRALQAQINPHFVYNTLNSIASVELLNGRQQVADVIGYLSQMLRYSIKDPDGLVTLGDEVKNVQCYIKIQQFCYHNLIQFECDIAPETRSLRIPKVILQPLVENSLIHGTNVIENDARIKLSTRFDGDHITIIVWDNGSDADVDRMNQYAKGDKQQNKHSDSLAIRNIYDRIRMVYGDKGELFFQKDENECTLAIIRIPAN